jgi:hypothetical protein
MLGDVETVNGAWSAGGAAHAIFHCGGVTKCFKKSRAKKAGPKRARLEVLASEADTITFQEGLLSFRATGGGGQMRNA